MATKTVSKSHAATGWTFDLVQDSAGGPAPGGLILKNIRHDSHNYARDVRVIGIWIRFDEIDHTNGKILSSTSRFITLDTTWFQAMQQITELDAKPTATPGPEDVAMMNYFVPAYGLRVIYASTPAVFAGINNSVMGSLLITQTWMFSAYSNNPPHEPSGGLSAARFHPVLTYRLTLDPKFDFTKNYTRVGSIRFDYRMHLRVDRSVSDPDGTSTTPSNHAGLFRDRDAYLGAPHFSGQGFSDIAFEAAEKPIAYEVIAPALYQGLSVKDVGAAQGGAARTNMEPCWDNIHWWGHRQTGQISAPGAFHAVHMHWRWGAQANLGKATNLGNFLPDLPSILNPRDVLANGTIYGALVDPGIWTQTLFVAVNKYSAALDPDKVALSNLSTQTFADLFTKGGGKPADVSKGDDLVLWYSTEIPYGVYMNINLPGSVPGGGGLGQPTKVAITSMTGGSIFMHGTFFAHDPERTGKYIGSTTEMYEKRTLQDLQANPTWYRFAKTV